MAAKDLNGVALALHGAMQTVSCDDGEGELLARLRAVVGPAVPIAVSLDPHANITRRMCDFANILMYGQISCLNYVAWRYSVHIVCVWAWCV